MVILNSCCCWRSVRKGSYACGLYTLVYFTLSAAMMSKLLHEELLYLRTNSSTPAQHSILEPNMTSETSIVFTTLILTISSVGILTSLLLLLGLYWDKRLLLVPWMLTLVPLIIVDMIHCIYLFVVHTLKFNPSSSILFTIDFFLMVLNVYALLCVISQYQELTAGRGRAENNNRIPTIHYTTQPTATSFLRRGTTCNETKASPTQSPTGTAPRTSLGTEEPSPYAAARTHRKSVKFPDHENGPQNGPQNGRTAATHLEPWPVDVGKSPPEKAPDTTPLIDTPNPITETKI